MKENYRSLNSVNSELTAEVIKLSEYENNYKVYFLIALSNF